MAKKRPKPESNREQAPILPKVPDPENPEPATGIASSPYLWAAVAAGLVGLLYAVTLAPTTAFWDTSEYIATAHILGIPHPPGNPLFVAMAKAWSLLLEPLGLSIAVRVNLFSALMGALAHGLWFLVMHRILGYFSEDRTFRIAGALIAVLVSATAFTVWNQSNVNEKVYTVSLFTIALLTWLALQWRDNLGKGKDDNLLVLIVFILALSVGNHLMALLAAPALVLFILFVHPKALVNHRFYIAGAAALLAGLSIYLFLPLRAGLEPVINEADPTCESIGGALTSIVTWGQAGCAELSQALSRQQYLKPPLLPRLAPIHSQFANYFQYFDWQWARSVAGTDTVFAFSRLPYTLLFMALGLFGSLEHRRRDRKSWWYFFTLFATLSAGLVFYLNFKYGHSLRAPIADRELHEVREREYFFIVSFSVWGLWAGLGIVELWRTLSLRFSRGLMKAAPVLALAFIPLGLNWSWASRADDYSARDWAHNLLMSVEPYGVLFTNGDNDTFPLWYLQEVEGIRRDVTVIVTSYLNTDWHAKQLLGLTQPCPEDVDPLEDPTRITCQRPYDASNTGAMYTSDSARAAAADKVPLLLDSPVAPPTRAIFGIDEVTIEEVAGRGYSQTETGSYSVGNMVATIRAGTYVYPWHQFALHIINHAVDERPIYFASSSNAAAVLGLTPYLIRQGLAFKLHNREPTPDSLPEGVRAVESQGLAVITGRFVDVTRTKKLLEEVFLHRSGIPDDWAFWPDEATVGIPNYYAYAYFALAQLALEAGNEEEVERYRVPGDVWQRLGGFDAN